MEGKVVQQPSRLATLVLVVLLTSSLAILQTSGSCSDDGSDCSSCILKRLKHDCPPCTTMLRCMAKCLWAGKSKARCTKKCDCYDKYPKLLDCKKCMSKCKCSCAY